MLFQSIISLIFAGKSIPFLFLSLGGFLGKSRVFKHLLIPSPFSTVSYSQLFFTAHIFHNRYYSLYGLALLWYNTFLYAIYDTTTLNEKKHL